MRDPTREQCIVYIHDCFLTKGVRHEAEIGNKTVL